MQFRPLVFKCTVVLYLTVETHVAVGTEDPGLGQASLFLTEYHMCVFPSLPSKYRNTQKQILILWFASKTTVASPTPSSLLLPYIIRFFPPAF